MTSPPRLAESLLNALGAPQEYRDLVLGDLAEEYAWRAEWDGVPSARHWYNREALRAVPYLLGSAVRALGARGLRRILGVAVSSLSMTLIVMAVIAAILESVLLSGILPPIASGLSPGLVVANLASCSLAGAIAGRFAASLDDQSPFLSALTTGLLLFTVEVLALTLSSLPAVSAIPIWYRIAAPAVLLVSSALGGLWGESRKNRAAVSGIGNRE